MSAASCSVPHSIIIFSNLGIFLNFVIINLFCIIFPTGQIVAGTAPCSICGLEAFCSSTCAANAHRTWHGAECLDASGKPLEPTLLSLSPECRVALRAVRRFMREETTEPSITATSAVARGSWYTPSGTPFSSNCCGKLVMGFGDLQGHYAARSSRQNDFLETEAAIASVLATGNGMESEENDIRGHGSGDPLVEESPQTLAAKLISALVKVTGEAACSTSYSVTGHFQCICLSLSADLIDLDSMPGSSNQWYTSFILLVVLRERSE